MRSVTDVVHGGLGCCCSSSSLQRCSVGLRSGFCAGDSSSSFGTLAKRVLFWSLFVHRGIVVLEQVTAYKATLYNCELPNQLQQITHGCDGKLSTNFWPYSVTSYCPTLPVHLSMNQTFCSFTIQLSRHSRPYRCNEESVSCL